MTPFSSVSRDKNFYIWSENAKYSEKFSHNLLESTFSSTYMRHTWWFLFLKLI